MRPRSSLLWFGLCLLGVAVVALFGPAEKSLGSSVRVVYLHGVWVWTALAAFTLAALAGLLGLLLRREKLQRWSRALGRTGLVFWVTYLPISMWAMQTGIPEAKVFSELYPEIVHCVNTAEQFVFRIREIRQGIIHTDFTRLAADHTWEHSARLLASQFRMAS